MCVWGAGHILNTIKRLNDIKKISSKATRNVVCVNNKTTHYIICNEGVNKLGESPSARCLTLKAVPKNHGKSSTPA